MTRVPGWVVDGGLAAALGGVALGVERLSGGGLLTRDVLLVVGGGSFLLLRMGAILALAGRTLGCLFVFTMTWLLPCAVALFFLSSYNGRVILRSSGPLFLLAGFFLIGIMIVTFERMRQADERRFSGVAPPSEQL